MTCAFALPIPTLTTDRQTLREPREADVPAMPALNDSPRAGFVGGGRDRQWIWRGLSANIGHIGVICHDGWDEPEPGWHLFDGAEGQGCAQEAALAARADYLARISRTAPISCIDAASHRSQALARRPGAVPEREAAFLDASVTVWRHPAPEALA